MEFESYTPKETQKTKETEKEYRFNKLNKTIQESTETLNFLHSLVGEGRKNAQNVLDKLRTRKEELLKDQQKVVKETGDYKTYNEMESEIQGIDKRTAEIFQASGEKDPIQTTEEEFQAGLKERQELVVKHLDQKENELASLKREG
ncbi:MAG: hypothetical protein COY22_00205 [Candidatus Tagabacteria bacterium CG_4_10_14_0_2_um_filter_40_13]|uniref:Uncharacterized protein n=2 Tax=Candidatus Tagaibacteriota TaxID=1817918 RepID=A0A2M8G8T4_9BACT|nr:MAG: hypothetical protein COV90_02570 [Candidatus Tagabacteria bacterium CG11_big_fil_rev_8_21_14_0_20_41_11]PIZ56759.1 MAG: hypothetical protein COY22_00205 [Candidatus Tagabacteria bacterium CG_4_10_14_0_2_um_filter_40_13]PJC25448.1 MAG: hypothetical protein CO056_00125 [Candidatus Tagabacteria bacterium CG_4_9_14_0_2_um_filter_41_11]PJC69768.1 MAG: hypothetical protein CO014_01745 [Candidatus Tagabacteria bacterium CG_4_8_14_3_um_filter_41_8]